jgi:tetratricopeptide (TPR) repeat protein
MIAPSGDAAMKHDTNPAQPRIDELMTRFLACQVEDRTTGLPELPLGEVEPYEAAFAPMVEPRVAFDEAVAALAMLDGDRQKPGIMPPPEWSALVSGAGSLTALAFAAGNFPQMVRDLPALVRSERRSDLFKAETAGAETPTLTRWARDAAAKANYPQCLFALGVLRVARQFAPAETLLAQLQASAPARWQPALANEAAALLWHSGRHEAALAAWNVLPATPAVLFNRGMAALFLDRPAEARPSLQQVVAQLPDDNAWHHLARLYLALTEI